ncbi:hypothetical protein NFI96_009972 [Prochilodus magdalenae]|nr:hypothetical protein NFI96_009972 [Prochilodus magdalenae]
MGLLGQKDEHTFILRNVSVLDSGNYSCVYSLTKHLPDNVRTPGHKSIQVQVTGILLVKSAVIRSGRTTVKKGEDIELTCSTSESEKPALLHVYICKDGLGKISGTVYNQTQTRFSIKDVNVEDSGVYSCVYSAGQYDISEVTDTERENSILIQVYGIRLVKSAVIRSGRTMVKKGEGIELTCSISESEKPALLHVYICKNGLGKISGTVYNQTQTRFSIKDVNVEDSGVYSCVYSAEQCDISEVNDTERENSILIQVYDISLVMTVSVSPTEKVDIIGNPTVKPGENLQLKCIISGKRELGDIHMYLCKNGVGVKMELLEDKDEYTFILRNVSVLDSGRYSCVYSLNKHLPNNVRTSGHKSIQVQVTGVKSAMIRSGRTMVKKGEGIELTCNTSESEQPALLHLYICKDGLGKISGTVYNQTLTRFYIKDVNLEDSGVYSCVYSAEQYDISVVNDTERENSILIQVYGEQL